MESFKKVSSKPSFYGKEESFAWDKWNEDIGLVAGLLLDLCSILDEEAFIEQEWDKLKLEDKNRYWTLFRALRTFINLHKSHFLNYQGVEGEKATKLDQYQIQDILQVIREQVKLTGDE